MKKLDILIIILVLVTGTAIFISYFNKINVDTSTSPLVVYYKSIKIDDPIMLREETDLVYHIESTDNQSRLKVEKINKEQNKTEVYYIDQPQKLKVHHTIEISYNSIRITEASCEGQDCIRGLMSYKNTIPIVCIVGISVMFEKLEIWSGGFQ